MFSRNRMKEYTGSCSVQIEQLKQVLKTADAVLIGAGAGLSTSAGFTYDGERFERYFSDFHQKYGITDMYSGGFYPYDTLEEYWAWWSRHIFYNRYVDAPIPVYRELLALVKDKDYFVLTTNVATSSNGQVLIKRNCSILRGIMAYGNVPTPVTIKPMIMRIPSGRCWHGSRT